MRPIAIAALFWALATPSLATPESDAEDLVRALYYEGLPEGAAEALDDAGIARLAEMLVDPDEAPHHGNIVSALGASGHPQAFDALADFAAHAPSGEVDRATFRAHSRVGRAMGLLARGDDRALRWLMVRTETQGPPGWHFRHHRDGALRNLLDEQVISGLAESGRPQAGAWLRRAEREVRGHGVAETRRRNHLENARHRHEQARGAGANR